MSITGRPSIYTEELADRICALVATHKIGLPKLCKMYQDLPNQDTINEWRWKYKSFSDKYLTAKQYQMNLIMEELDDIIDENIIYYTDDKGTNRIDSPSATVAIAKANNRKWFASKIAPKLYGDRHAQEESNPQETLQKIQSLVADLNKTNQSDI